MIDLVEFTKALDAAKHIMVIQAENPDGDSLGSSLALEEILSDMGKTVYMYCPVDIPKYLRYIRGWDRVSDVFDNTADLAIIVDTSADVLLGKVQEAPGADHFLNTKPVLVIDHHETESTLKFPNTLISQLGVSTGEVIYDIATQLKWGINQQAAEDLMISILSDSLGLTTQSSTAHSFFIASKLVELGAIPSDIETRRRDLMKKSAEILKYKGQLIERIEYYLDGQLALVHIPWEEIQEYSDQYNPSVLVLDEMRLVEGVKLAVAIKTYPDGKLTGKLRGNDPIAETVARYFGGGGHPYAAGFRVYDSYETILKDLIDATDKAVKEHDSQAT